MNNKGIIFLNSGSKLLPRLITSLHSLRQHYQDNITILVIGNENNNLYEKIAAEYSTSVVNIDFNLKIRHHYWFEKSRLHLYTPYQNSIFLDSDTIVLNNFNELFDEIEKYDFIASQFAHWKSSGRTIRKRLRQWSSTDHNLVEDTIKKDIPSVNMGLYGFKKSSELMKHWFDLTIKHPTASLPEETTCHLLLTQYKSKIVSNIYNCSCKHDNPRDKEVKVVHYHGRKHCRLDESYRLKFNGSIWMQHWKDVLDKNICDIQNWYDKCGDRYLNKLMKNIDKVRI
jgi:hypothetical protein